jgi:hypothetical protein
VLAVVTGSIMLEGTLMWLKGGYGKEFLIVLEDLFGS